MINDKIDELYDSGKIKELLEYCTEVLEKDPSNLHALLNKGLALYFLGNLEKSIHYFQKTLEIDPSNLTAINGLSKVLFKSEMYEESIIYDDKALELDPNHLDSLRGKAASLFMLDRHDEALEFYQKSLQVEPNHFHSLIGIGGVYQDLNQYEDAIIYYKKAMTQYPNEIRVLTGLGDCYNFLGKKSEAASFFEKALAIDPSDEIAIQGSRSLKNNHYSGNAEPLINFVENSVSEYWYDDDGEKITKKELLEWMRIFRNDEKLEGHGKIQGDLHFHDCFVDCKPSDVNEEKKWKELLENEFYREKIPQGDLIVQGNVVGKVYDYDPAGHFGKVELKGMEEWAELAWLQLTECVSVNGSMIEPFGFEWDEVQGTLKDTPENEW